MKFMRMRRKTVPIMLSFWMTDGDDLVKGRGRQVLEKYTGSEATLEMPMGVTDIDLKENSTELAGTDRE